MVAKKIGIRQRRSTIDSHYHNGSEWELELVAKRFRKQDIFGKVFLGKTIGSSAW
jgi:hypothetical protein